METIANRIFKSKINVSTFIKIEFKFVHKEYWNINLLDIVEFRNKKESKMYPQ